MRRKATLIKIISFLILVFFVTYYSTSFSKSLVIRRTILLHGYPIGAITTPVQNEPDSEDERYGKCYVIENPKVNNGTEHAVPGVCMKKNEYGYYYDVSIGVF